MKVSQLQELLSDLEPDLEVRIGSQSRWPFEYEIRDVLCVERKSDSDEFVESESKGKSESKPTVYIVEGDQIGYLPGYVTEAIGWI